MANKKLKPWVAIIVILILGAYFVDAAYPTWSWTCSSQSALGGVPVIPEVQDNGQADGSTRHLKLTIPKGCTASANNKLRKLVDWVVNVVS